MIIAVDLDDVLADSLVSFIEFHNKSYQTELKPESFTSYSIKDIFKISEEEEAKRLEEFDNSIHSVDIKPMIDSVDVIKNLSKKHKIIVITSRPKTIKNETEKWIKKYFSSIKEIYFTKEHYLGKTKTKTEICKEINAEIIIEDNLGWAENCAENGIRVLLFNYPWNQREKLHPLIKRVNSWKEILEILEKL